MEKSLSKAMLEMMKINMLHKIDTIENIDEPIDNIGHVTLHFVAQVGDAEIFEKIFQRNPNVNIKTRENGFTPLHKAASFGQSLSIRLLAEAGAELEIKTTDKGLTPLLLACMRGHADAVEALIEVGSNVNATDMNEATALHGAAFYDYLEIAKLLLVAGADPYAPDKQGNTPLSLARDKGFNDVYNLLESFNA